MKTTPLEPMKRFKMKQLVIGSWCFHNTYDEAYCELYKGAGFNTMVDAPPALDPAGRAGLKVILTTQVHPVYDRYGREVPGRFKLGPYARLDDIKWFHSRYGRHRALIGYLLNDNCKLHDYTVQCARWLKANAPGMFPYMSHNPDAAGQARVVDVMPILSSQNYPFGYHNDWPEAKKRRAFCDRLEADRAWANAHGMAAWPIFAALGKPDLGASQIRFQAFASLAYGAQGLFYFAYSTGRAAWKPDGTAYRASSYCNGYIKGAVGPRVLGCRSIGVFHAPLDDDLPKGALAPGAGRLIEKMDAGLLAGVLVAEKDFKAGKKLPAYVLVVDKRTARDKDRQPPPRTVRVTFGRQVGTVKVLARLRARAVRVENRTAVLELQGGDARLLEITPAGPAAAR